MIRLNGLAATALMQRIECSAAPGVNTRFAFAGLAWSRRAGEQDRLLFGLEGMLVRGTTPLVDPHRGQGFQRLGRELMVIRDAVSGAVLDHWDNPFTGERVDVVHVANDHVNGTYFERDAAGGVFSLTLERTGPFWQHAQVLPIRRPNPLGAGYEREIGGMYHACEMFGFTGLSAQIDDPACAALDVAVNWTRLSDWYPWMGMEGREGMIYVHTTGAKLALGADLPGDLQTLIDTRFPVFNRPPPPGDSGAMDTSWSEYRRIRETGARWYEQAA